MSVLSRHFLRGRGRLSFIALGVSAALGVTLAQAGPAAGLGSPAAASVAVPRAALAGAPASGRLVGSLQSELGCPYDWAPPCEATMLAPVAGTSTWERTFTVPAGTYEYKVAINGGWDENYGTGGVSNGPNYPFVLAGPTKVRFRYDAESHLVTLGLPDLPGTRVTAGDRALAGRSLRDDLTRERFYFVMTDRFANGSTANDLGGYPDAKTAGLDPTHKGYYHGGDLAGLTSKLDYIKGLGTTSIWLTPSFKNKPVQDNNGFPSAGYHGYWITDFTQIDPHMGTNAELKTLIDRAHAKGMKVFFDIITNHTADVIDYTEKKYDYVDKATSPYQDASGTVFDDKAYAGKDTFPAMDAATSFPYTPVFPTEADKTVKVPAWLNDPTLYHNRGNSTFAGESSEYGDFFGLDDLFTENHTVVKGMEDIYNAWVDFGVDGFRIDTTKHVNMEFWQDFIPSIRKEAANVGTPDFFAFGEVFDADPRFTSRYSTQGTLQATLDFPFQAKAQAFATGKETTGLRDVFAADDWHIDADGNNYAAPTFLGNHDMGRIGNFIRTGVPGVTADETLQRDMLANSLMFTSRGQPVVYYGDEQGFVGDGGDQDARQDMFPSKVATYNDDDLIGTDATTAQDNFDTAHPLYRWISGLARLRAQHPALADGAQVHRYSSDAAGVYAFSRVDRATGREYVVALNSATTAKTASFATYGRGGAQFAGLFGGAKRLVADREGRVTVTVPPLTALVWKAEAGLPRRTAAPSATWVSPAPGGTLSPAPAANPAAGRVELRVAVPENAFSEVTYAWRVAGAGTWTKLGTDDNAPYRVMPDVSGLAKGTVVETRAVVRDASGNLAASSSFGVVGEPSGGGTGGGGPIDPVVQPANVSVPGDHNSEMGCAADWMPDCDQAQLTRDPKDDVWKGTYTIPAGAYAYKAAVNKSWDENYGVGAVANGGNISYTNPGTVSFYYDHGTHWVTSDAQGPIITAPGSFQSELGCPADWSPDCMRSWLQDPDGDGTFTFRTDRIPAGSYEMKAAHGLAWTENYGAGGVRDGGNIPFAVPADGTIMTFSYVLSTHVLTVTASRAGSAADLSKAKAHWVARDLVAWPADQLPDVDPGTLGWRLHWSKDGGLGLDAEAVTGGESAALTWDPKGLPADVVAKYPALKGYVALRLPDRVARQAPSILTGQVAVGLYDDLGALLDASGVQVPGVLDDLYAGKATGQRLGVTFDGAGTPSAAPTFRLWAPTAQSATLLVWPAGRALSAAPVRVRPEQSAASGVWTAEGGKAWRNARYLWEVTVWAPSAKKVVTNRVTDPYSTGLTTGSTHSVAVDLADPAFRPAPWRTAKAPALKRSVDQTIYELHVRDYSIDDSTVPAAHRGTYLAFADEGLGRKHLRELAKSGLTTVHLLPTFDIATIEEDRAKQAAPDCDLPSLPADSDAQQACVGAVAGKDGYNWGYDPYHWSVPEGSYATDPDGGARVAQFRTMVGALHSDGLHVVLDQVFNHTAESGQGDRSVLDKVVPGYYHRLNPKTGAVETSTCCQNVATEHALAEKLMVDSVVRWARDYKVDGFRFDLMGHASTANMLAVRSALDALTPAKDGVDGRKVYVYGEGWNFGEVANDALFVQARQGNLGGTGIGTFSDRLRDGVRGGGPFDEDPRKQGFGSGLFTDPNASPANGTADEQKATLLHDQDLVKLGMAGNLRAFTFTDATGKTVRGDQVDYNGSPAGYADQPDEVITYVDAHDNETLWDALTYKLPPATPMADRVRMNTVSMATVALAQTPAFFHAGSDLLRSKSLDRNSFDSGDWFNHLGWPGAGVDNGFGRGLPPKADNESKWPYARPLLGDPALKPSAADVATATAGAQDLLRLRFSSPLFRLGSADEITKRVSFPLGGPDQTPGVVVMRISDTVGTDLDPTAKSLLVVLNASPKATTQTVTDLVGASLALSPVQTAGADPVVRTTSWEAAKGAVTVPARTVAVLVEQQ
ncbi:MAG: pullulanase-type alpha-1,6-glucosidase [Actinobacteria bacterium]|nr:pullulanase-type alpha-1,6-glucosidase [Actinomycetota bacterium]